VNFLFDGIAARAFVACKCMQQR